MTTDLDGPQLGDKQLDFLKNSNVTTNILEGSIRSGKTIISLFRWFFFLAMAPWGGELVMVGRTRDAIFRNIIKPMQDPSLFGPLAYQVIYTNGAPTATILGRTVHIIGASDAKAEKIIRGMTVAGAYVDEITVIPEEFFTQLLGRMSVKGAQLFGTTNPDSPAHWFKKKFLNRVGKALKDWKVWKFDIDDNPSLSEEYKNRIKSEFTGLWYRRFILGDWVAAEGAIFDSWNEALHVIPFDERPPIAELIAVGLDYGTTNPTHAVALAITAEPEPRLLVVDEWRYVAGEQGARWTDAQLSEGLRTWLAGLRKELNLEPRWIFLDPAAASFHTQLMNDGVRGLTHADNSVAYGIRTVASLLSTHKLIVTDRCKYLIDEFPGYSWDPKATEKGEDKPIAVADHGLDGLRYAIVTSERYWNNRIRQHSLAA